MITVLFADLVGFTTLSEHRDPDEVRELMGRYYDRCRTLIERYGGTVVRFIGDAVMALWGTPVAREDDSERAVRAGLALAHAVGDLGDPLRVRVGILTGTAAVELGAEREGMVHGDAVNTASRLQSIAAPGTVLVDDVTRRASEAAMSAVKSSSSRSRWPSSNRCPCSEMVSAIAHRSSAVSNEILAPLRGSPRFEVRLE